MNRFDTALFDMDGVIADTEHLHVRAEQETCKDFDFDIDPEDWEGYKGRTAVDIFRHLISTYGDPSKHSLEELMEHKTDKFIELAQTELEAIEGAVMFLNWARGYFPKMGLVTSSNSRVQGFIVEKLKVGHLFDTVVAGDDIENGKPHPEPYEKALLKLGASARRALVVEDSISGIDSAHAADCEVLAITTSHSADDLMFGPGPLFVVDRFDQASPLIVNYKKGRKFKTV